MARAAVPVSIRRGPVRSAVLGALSLALAGVAAAPARAQAPPSSPDDFVAAAAGSDGYEVMAARVALTESHDRGVRAFAEEMVRDHEASSAALRAAASRSGLQPPAFLAVGGDQTALLAALQGLRGEVFDRAYARQQTLAHRQALATLRGYVRNGSDAGLRAFAQADMPMVERHLRAAQALERPSSR